MAVAMWGQIAIQASMPQEDPIKVGSLWIDISSTPAVKVCTATAPYTFAAVESGSSTAWGDITGTLANQTDLQAALDAKAALSHVHSAADLTSGTVPDARFPATLPAVSGANLTALNASNLGSGTVPLARLSGITNTEISGSAAIAYAKLALTGAVVNADIAAAAAIAWSKLANVSATDKLLGRSTAGAGAIEEITCTATARSILDDTSVGAVRTTLGVGTADAPTFGGLTLAGTVAMADNVIGRPELRDVGETKNAGSATTGACTLDITNANFFEITTTGNITFTFSNPSASGIACSITVKINYGGAHTVTWPAAVRWAGSTPTATSTNAKTDIFVFTTTDGGTKWFGAVGGQNYTT